MNDYEKLIKLYEKLIQLAKLCFIFSGTALICCVIGLIMSWFSLFRSKAKVKVNDKEITINLDDKEELHREILKLKKIIKKLQNDKK